MSRSSLSILIPAYNESATLGNFYAEVCRVLPSIADDWEIVFCDDASTDDTAVIIAGILKNDPYARAIHHARNLGIRQTFEDLYQAAQKDYVVLLPGDGQWPAEALHQALYAMGSHAAVVLARRDKQYTVFRASIHGCLMPWFIVVFKLIFTTLAPLNSGAGMFFRQFRFNHKVYLMKQSG